MRPLCSCHGEPMHRNGKGKSPWRCAVKNTIRAMQNYDAQDGVAYNRRLLQLRRWKALRRREKRNER